MQRTRANHSIPRSPRNHRAPSRFLAAPSRLHVSYENSRQLAVAAPSSRCAVVRPRRTQWDCPYSFIRGRQRQWYKADGKCRATAHSEQWTLVFVGYCDRFDPTFFVLFSAKYRPKRQTVTPNTGVLFLFEANRRSILRRNIHCDSGCK